MHDPACEKPRRGVLADPCLSGHLRERAVDDRGESCRAGGDDDLLEVDRLAGRGLVRFYTEAGNGSMHVDVPEETARSVARWILDHTNV